MTDLYNGDHEVDIKFLLSVDAEPIRKVAESLYPAYLLETGNDPISVPVMDEKFMTSKHARWVRVLAEVAQAEVKMEKDKIDNTIAIFGSARIQSDGKLGRFYDECVDLSDKLTKWSMKDGEQKYMIVTGGGPGIMEAGNRGADRARGMSIGLNITLPFEASSNQYITGEYDFDFHYFFTRKFHFSYRAKCFIAFPGGFGTFDEIFEILTLIQTQKISKKPQIVLYGKEYWDTVVNFEKFVEWGLISKEDLDLFTIVDDVDTAYKLITDHLQ